jgi:hypothetical protein
MRFERENIIEFNYNASLSGNTELEIIPLINFLIKEMDGLSKYEIN